MAYRQRVVWSKGMFLVPQHFQAQDRAINDAIQLRFSSSLFANWGVVQLKINIEALAEGTVEFTRGSGIFPDGLPFDFPDTDRAPSKRTVAEFFSADDESLDVYLAVPEVHEGAAIARTGGDESQSGSHRFSTQTVELTDDNGTGDKKTLQLAKPNLRLVLGRQNREGFESLQVARILRAQGNKYKLDPEFIAPCLDIASSAYLMDLLRRQLEILSSKSDSLSGARRQRGQNLAEFSGSEAAKFWLLHTVNTSRPELNHIWSVRHGHPEPLYVAMLRLAGALSTFSLDAKAKQFPEYNHADLGRCFTNLDQRIRLLLEAVIPDKFTSIPLRLVEKSIWAGQIASDELLKNTQFFLSISAKVGVDDLIKRTPQVVKIASTEEIQNIVRHALPGLTLRHTPSPPSAIPFKLDSQYFSLNQSGRLWDKISQSRSVSVFVPAELPEVNMELLVVSQ